LLLLPDIFNGSSEGFLIVTVAAFVSSTPLSLGEFLDVSITIFTAGDVSFLISHAALGLLVATNRLDLVLQGFILNGNSADLN